MPSACSSSERTYPKRIPGNSPDHSISKHIQKPPSRINTNTEGCFRSLESSQTSNSTFKDTTFYEQKEPSVLQMLWDETKHASLIFNPPPFTFPSSLYVKRKILAVRTLIVPSNKPSQNTSAKVTKHCFVCGILNILRLTTHKNQFRAKNWHCLTHKGD